MMTMPPRDRRRDVFISYGGHVMTVWYSGAQCSCGWEWTLFRIPRTWLERKIRRHWRDVPIGPGAFVAFAGPAIAGVDWVRRVEQSRRRRKP